MAENQSEAKSPWICQIVTGPEHDIKVNDKELVGLEQYLQQLAKDKDLNWWELANVLTYIACGQIGAADYEVKGTEASVRFLSNVPEMLAVHISALARGDNLAINPSSQTIN